MTAKDDFSNLMQDVLVFIAADDAEQVEGLFNQYKNKHLPDLMEIETTNSCENENEKREKFCKLLMESLVNTNSGDGITMQENFSSLSDLMRAVRETKKEMDVHSSFIVRKGCLMGNLFLQSKRFGKFKEAFQAVGYSRAWANFLINLCLVYQSHPNIGKTSLSLHCLRSNMAILQDITHYLPDFDKIE